jgi:hypothetical protein
LARLTTILLLAMLLGGFCVGYLWLTINHLIEGDASWRGLALALGAAVVLTWLVTFVVRTIDRSHLG